MKPIENTSGTECSFPKLVGAAAGALTSTLAATFLRRARSKPKRKTRSRALAPATKGGVRHG